MNNFRQIAEHYYEQVSSQMQGGIAEAFQLQKTDLIGHIARTIEDTSPQMAASQLNALANFGQSYNGRSNPYLGDVFSSMQEMIDTFAARIFFNGKRRKPFRIGNRKIRFKYRSDFQPFRFANLK